MKKRVVWFAIMLLALACAGAVADTSTGCSGAFAIKNGKPVVVLVRGLRVAWEKDQQVPHYWDDAVDYLEEDFDVWPCDTIRGMDDVLTEATRLNSYIRARISERKEQGCGVPEEINIVAHSYGGLITRRFLHRYCSSGGEMSLEGGEKTKVGKVAMLSGVNCGSHVADIGRAWAWVHPLHNNRGALDCLKTRWVQNTFNYVYNDRDPWVPFYLVAGTGGETSSDWTLREGWKHLIHWPEGTFQPNDGAVSVLSAKGYAQSPWYPSPTFQVGSVWNRTTADDHTQLTRNPATLEIVRKLLLGEAVSGGTMAFSAPMQEGSQPQAMVTSADGIILEDQIVQTATLIDDCPHATFSLDRGAGEVSFTLTKPDATVIDKTSADPTVHYEEESDEDYTHCQFTIDNPALGTWTVNLHGDSVDPSGCPWSMLVSEESDVNVVPETDYFQSAGAALLKARVSEGEQAIVGATVSAAISRPDDTTDTIDLYDDGAHSDGAASDGLYANTYVNSTTPGVYNTRYQATGTNLLSHAFQRIEFDSFQVGPQTASLTGAYSDQGVDTGPPPGFEEIAVDVGIHVAADGDYAVSAGLSDSSSNELAAATAEADALTVGDTVLTLRFNADTLRRAGINGPYKLTDVALWDSSNGTLLRTDYAAQPYTTAAYNLSQFSDEWPPEPVNDLTIAGVDPLLGNVALRWSAPDNEAGPAASYDIRYLDSTLSAETWGYGTSLANPPTPASPGTTQTVSISGLSPGKMYSFAVKSQDATGNESALSNVVEVYIGPPLDVRNAPSGTYGGVIGVVTASGTEFGGTYIESEQRAWGVLVDSTGLEECRRIYVTGVLQKDGAEPMLASPHVYDFGAAEAITPVGVTGRALSASDALTTTGLLTRTWGAFGYVDETSFTVNDGSGPVKCVVPEGVTIDSGWQFVGVTGISSCEKVNEEIHRLLRVRCQEDITAY